MTRTITSTEPGRTSRRRTAVVSVAVLVLATENVLVNRVLPGWAYPVCGVVTAGALIGLARASGVRAAALGLARRRLRRSALTGFAGAGIVVVIFGVALAVPGLRTLFDDGRMGSPDLGQLLWLAAVRIPLGTVLLEEIAFRGVLPALLGYDGESWRWRPALGAAALFGLWHLLPSLALTENAGVASAVGGLPLPVVSLLAMLGAAAVGVLLHAWRHLGRGVLSTALVHLATNSGGLALAWLVAR